MDLQEVVEEVVAEEVEERVDNSVSKSRKSADGTKLVSLYSDYGTTDIAGLEVSFVSGKHD